MPRKSSNKGTMRHTRGKSGMAPAAPTLPAFIVDLPAGDDQAVYTEHSLRDRIASWAGGRLTQLDPDKIAEGAIKVLKGYDYVIQKIATAAKQAGSGLEFDTVEIGLTVDAKGSVGFATMGVEATLKFVWKRAATTQG